MSEVGGGVGESERVGGGVRERVMVTRSYKENRIATDLLVLTRLFGGLT